MWTYRVVRQTHPDGDVSYGIHEAYDDGDTAHVREVTSEPVACTGGTVEEVRAMLARMQVAVDQPVLEYDAFVST
jgi:hypothetical protein